MAEYTLYCFAQSGNSYKVALALQLAGADWTPRFVDERIRAEPRWVYPYELTPGHPLPQK